MNAIRQHREGLKLSQERLAELLGIDRSAVAKWETGKAMPTADKLPELARILGCTIDDLFKSVKGKET